MKFLKRLVSKFLNKPVDIEDIVTVRPKVVLDRTVRARTEAEKELEERVWKLQLEHRSKVLKERFAAQREWMAKYEEDERRRQEAVQ
ncbi:hypothetical protein [Fredinandcohnia sp. 179-A 10B2 NHS]|uniref:hypothetical protein n=1 Tax=Fredinandcohnia sp. 179-A 10B2 NHS TaxID=3235176 RepID=UPI0039A08836